MANILVIGDSHTAGPFGKYLFANLKNNYQGDIVVLGHASSAPIHWLSGSAKYLSGGVYNRAYINEAILVNPNPTHWRAKVRVPNFDSLMKNTLYHESWKKKYVSVRASTVVVALGANDFYSVTSRDGVLNQSGFNKRKAIAKSMSDKIVNSGAKCLWVKPPSGIKKNPRAQAHLYQMIDEAISKNCEIFDSSHFYVKGCDGVHMNCSSEMANARKWADEVSDFIMTKAQ